MTCVWRSYLVAGALFAGAAPALGADRETFFLQSGGGRLQSIELEAFREEDGGFDFHFTFETDEMALPNSAHDSVTISLLGENSLHVAALVTLDVFGLTIAPSNPGGLFVQPSWVTANPAAALRPTILTFSQSFAVHFDIPAELQGQPLRSAVDFFDNQDGIASRVQVTLTVPEPATAGLLLGGLAGVYAARRRRS